MVKALRSAFDGEAVRRKTGNAKILLDVVPALELQPGIIGSGCVRVAFSRTRHTVLIDLLSLACPSRSPLLRKRRQPLRRLLRLPPRRVHPYKPRIGLVIDAHSAE
jgi:hypothetical protein